MPIVKKLSKCCKKCSILYKSNSKSNGICPKCSKRRIGGNGRWQKELKKLKERNKKK